MCLQLSAFVSFLFFADTHTHTHQEARCVAVLPPPPPPPLLCVWPRLGTLWRWEGAKKRRKKKGGRKGKKWTICCFRCAANPLIEPLLLFKLAAGAKLLMKF